MSTPFLGEIKIVSFNYAPKSWAICTGQLLPITQNQALFSLLGTTYGGDGRTTFALPDFRGRAPCHFGNGMVLGEAGGEAFHTLTINEIPQHTHQALATSAASVSGSPVGTLLGNISTLAYGPANATTTLQPDALARNGDAEGHENRQPFLALNFIISLSGIFPSHN